MGYDTFKGKEMDKAMKRNRNADCLWEGRQKNEIIKGIGQEMRREWEMIRREMEKRDWKGGWERNGI